MDHEFWQQRWELNEIGFHNDAVHPSLEKFWPLLAKTPQDSVLVPLCGKSKDMLWLARRGHQVIGVELSPIAVAAFFSENQLEPAVMQKGGFNISESSGVELWRGDYFALPENQLSGIGKVYDRAALVALPTDMRRNYVEKLRGLLPSGAKILLITLEYDQAEMSGPPFRVDREEIEQLYGGWCEIDNLGIQNVLEQEPKLKARGLSNLEERVYWITVL